MTNFLEKLWRALKIQTKKNGDKLLNSISNCSIVEDDGMTLRNDILAQAFLYKDERNKSNH